MSFATPTYNQKKKQATLTSNLSLTHPPSSSSLALQHSSSEEASYESDGSYCNDEEGEYEDVDIITDTDFDRNSLDRRDIDNLDNEYINSIKSNCDLHITQLANVKKHGINPVREVYFIYLLRNLSSKRFVYGLIKKCMN